jgi:hypothetical protein
MRRLAVLLLAGILAGCAGSSTAPERQTTHATTTTGASSDAADDAPPTSYEEVIARLPPLDVPASDEVEEYREAAITSFLEKRLPKPKLPPRPTGEQYPVSSEDFRGDPPPTEYEVEPGTTCERILTADQSALTLIIPPPPGVTARIEDKPFKLGSATFDGSVVVKWSLGTVHGDCPPSELILSYPTVTAFTIHEPVHSKSGVTRMPLLDVGPRPTLLRATAVSVDGHHSRQVAVLLR